MAGAGVGGGCAQILAQRAGGVSVPAPPGVSGGSAHNIRTSGRGVRAGPSGGAGGPAHKMRMSGRGVRAGPFGGAGGPAHKMRISERGE